MNIDHLLIAADCSLRTLFSKPYASRSSPTCKADTAELTEKENNHSAALMRVNHVGEVCAQALYSGQCLATQDSALKNLFEKAGREEVDHLVWCRQRLDQLGGKPSLLNPIWYIGAFAMGYAAGKIGGDAQSLGFVAETERQVEQHLADHLSKLPVNDHASRVIITQMKQDEAAHGAAAVHAGATELPKSAKSVMKAVSKIMTTVAYRI